MKQRKSLWWIIISLLFFFICNSCIDELNADLDENKIPLGTSYYFENGRVKEFENTIYLNSLTNIFRFGFTGSYSGHDLDAASFGMYLDLNTHEFKRSRYSVWVELDQRGYAYKPVKGTEFINVSYLDTIERTIKVSFGSSFIRTDKNQWKLDELPYRIDCVGFIHDKY